MDVAVAGGHGQIGLRLLRLLADGGHRARPGNPGHRVSTFTVEERQQVKASSVDWPRDTRSDCGAPRAYLVDRAIYGAKAGPVRPGGLTGDPVTGRVRVGTGVDYAYVPRDDVAAVLLAVLEELSSVGKTFELVSSDTPIQDAVRSL